MQTNPCKTPKTFDLLVMPGMLAGHAGDVENDANDVDGLTFRDKML